MKSGQSKTESFVEACTNTFIGFWINFVANWLLLPIVFGIHVNLHDNLLLGGLFTIISVARSYVLRRFFNTYLRTFAKWVSSGVGGTVISLFRK